MTMKRFSFAVVCSGLMIVAAPSQVALAQATNPFVGELITVAFNFCPVGWAAPNGQLMPISQNTALFSLLGTTYGGDGQTTFALPTVKPIFTATGVPLLQCISLFGVFPSRN
jgi:microcystin-dependent protein